MMAFVNSALPWILMGIAIAIYIAKYESNKETYLREGFFLGIVFGAFIGFFFFDGNSLFLPCGILIGEILGLNVRKQRQ